MTVAVPTLADVTRPVAETVATVVGVMVQDMDGLVAVLPSLLVPTAFICTVLFVFPVSMVGLAGPTASELSVGFTKNPRQLMAKASEARAAKAPMRRSLDFSANIVFSTAPVGRPLACSGSGFVSKNCSRENSLERTLVPELRAWNRLCQSAALGKNERSKPTCRKSCRAGK